MGAYTEGRMQSRVTATGARIAADGFAERLAWWRGRRDAQRDREALRLSVKALWANRGPITS